MGIPEIGDHMNVGVFLLFDGDWKTDDCGVSSFVSSSCRGVNVPRNATYEELASIVYNSIGVDKLRYDLVFKAWRSRENALMAVRGTVEDSYGELPSYLFMLHKKNPGCCRPVLCIDASFLKHKVRGQLLVAIALDANEQLYPVAFGVVDLENNNSWTYFMQQLRLTIGSVPNLIFISDRHPSIANALSAVFPKAHHSACTYHIKMNIVAKFKTDNCHVEFDLASRAYTESMFQKHFDKIRTKDPMIAQYLEQIGVERWSRAFFPGSRYNQMTSFTQLNRGAWLMRRHVIQFFIIMKLGTFPNISRNESA
ncbi:uncharacterized protein LOC124939366 [Impatiens glandulifera]|uniref:uncharacterized protein LOC124939366 n=1 Tax=Impatiens glandulifera TaxID=253017 RepID=UPI001FB07993|nr:uncharacterized protein LOC124939366 [Impatiens glandulifera]